jgi:hypothetical protein
MFLHMDGNGAPCVGRKEVLGQHCIGVAVMEVRCDLALCWTGGLGGVEEVKPLLRPAQSTHYLHLPAPHHLHLPAPTGLIFRTPVAAHLLGILNLGHVLLEVVPVRPPCMRQIRSYAATGGPCCDHGNQASTAALHYRSNTQEQAGYKTPEQLVTEPTHTPRSGRHTCLHNHTMTDDASQ